MIVRLRKPFGYQTLPLVITTNRGDINPTIVSGMMRLYKAIDGELFLSGDYSVVNGRIVATFALTAAEVDALELGSFDCRLGIVITALADPQFLMDVTVQVI